MNITWRLSLLMVVLAAGVGYAVPVTDGLIIHFEADRLDLEDGATVSLWPDSEVINGVDGTLLPASGAGQPTFKADAYNGMPAVHFDNVAQQALMSDVWSWDDTAGITVILRSTGGEANSDRVGNVGDAAGANFKTFAMDVSSDTSGAANTGSGVRYNNGWTLTATASTNPVVEGQWQHSIRMLGPVKGWGYGDLFYAVDGVTGIDMATNQASRAVDFDPDNNIVCLGNSYTNSGSWTGGSDWYGGDVAEMLVYNRELSTAEMQEVLGYLDAKYARQLAHYPAPASGSANQGDAVAGEIEIAFSWSTGLDAAGTGPNGSITEHRLYLTKDPNVPATVSPIVIPAGSPVAATASYGPITVDTDSTYYWRVDEVVDGGVIAGSVWRFETWSASPVILTDVEDQGVAPGGTATFSVETFSISTLTHEWFRSGDDAVDTPDDDSSLGTTSELTITPAQVADEGFYFCELSNDAGTVYTDVARLGVKREIIHYTLDAADWQAGEYLDVTGGHDAVQFDPNVIGFVAGADPAVTNEGVDIAADFDGVGAAVSEPVCTTFGTGAVTVSAWVNWVGAGRSSWQGLLTNSGPAYPWNFLLEVTPAPALVFRLNASGTILESQTLPQGEWTHVVVSMGPEALAIYFNGHSVASAEGRALNQYLDQPVNLGCLREAMTAGVPTGLPIHYFNGAIDEVRVFNYELSAEDVATLYYDVTGEGACITPPTFDVAGGGPDGNEPDCKMDLADLAALAADWLESGIRPISQ